jgi:hypothetical protein
MKQAIFSGILNVVSAVLVAGCVVLVTGARMALAITPGDGSALLR